MKKVEVELRCLVEGPKFLELLAFFNKNALLEREGLQTTYYYDCPEDLRIQKSATHSKVWLKKGKMHDNAREEVEIRLPPEAFEKLEAIFSGLGMKPGVKWFRNRRQFKWGGIKACLDDTRGYGRILELEKLVPEGKEPEALSLLGEKLVELGLEPTPKAELDRKFRRYVRNWRRLTE